MKVAEPTVERLVQYCRLLAQLRDEGRMVVSSQQMGEALGIKGGQVRKDLSCFGEIGKRGVGYHVDTLYFHLAGILFPPKVWKIGMVGAGRLGMALMGHSSFRNSKISIEAVFDVALDKVGRNIEGVRCYHADEMCSVVDEKGIELLVLCVPAGSAQPCVDRIAKTGVRGILSFATASIVVPDNIRVYSVDITVELEKLLFYLGGQGASGV